MTPRLTPVDILNKRFSRRFSGYHSTETDAFLREIAADMEAVLLENAAQREQLAALEREMTRYRSLENTMRDALVLGQKAADEIRDAARAQAAARMEAAQQRVESLAELTERLRLDRRRLAHEMRALLESQMAWLDYEMDRDAPQQAVATLAPVEKVEKPETVRIEAPFAPSAAIAAFASNGSEATPSVSSAEHAALTDRANPVGANLLIELQDQTAPRNGASDAVLSENA